MHTSSNHRTAARPATFAAPRLSLPPMVTLKGSTLVYLAENRVAGCVTYRDLVSGEETTLHKVKVVQEEARTVTATPLATGSPLGRAHVTLGHERMRNANGRIGLNDVLLCGPVSLEGGVLVAASAWRLAEANAGGGPGHTRDHRNGSPPQPRPRVHTGRIETINDRGFGFIRPDEGGDRVHVWEKALHRQTPWQAGLCVTYSIRLNERGPTACDVKRVR